MFPYNQALKRKTNLHISWLYKHLHTTFVIEYHINPSIIKCKINSLDLDVFDVLDFKTGRPPQPNN